MYFSINKRNKKVSQNENRRITAGDPSRTTCRHKKGAQMISAPQLYVRWN